jgi:hypothetical protein
MISRSLEVVNFRRGFVQLKFKYENPLLDLELRIKNVVAKIIFISTNLSGRFGRSTEGNIAEQFICFYAKIFSHALSCLALW